MDRPTEVLDGAVAGAEDNGSGVVGVFSCKAVSINGPVSEGVWFEEGRTYPWAWCISA